MVYTRVTRRDANTRVGSAADLSLFCGSTSPIRLPFVFRNSAFDSEHVADALLALLVNL